MTEDRFPTRFKKGLVPWNKGRKGINYSGMEATQFKPGARPKNKVAIGTEKIRKRDGNKRVWVKISDNGNSYDWQPRSRFVWELHNGPIPEGEYVIHKIDDDPMNDAIENLQLMTRAEHIIHHKPEFEVRRLLSLKLAAVQRRQAIWDKYYWEFEAEADRELEESWACGFG